MSKHLNQTNLSFPANHCTNRWTPAHMEPSHGVLVLGLNPGLQHILRLRALDLGQDCQDSCEMKLFSSFLGSCVRETRVWSLWTKVNRAEAHTLGVGGKGQNAAKAACTFALACATRSRCRVAVAQFLGGYTGEQIRELQAQQGIEDITVTGAMTRQFMTLVDYPKEIGFAPTVSELITPSEPISPAAAEELLSKVVAIWLANGREWGTEVETRIKLQSSRMHQTSSNLKPESTKHVKICNPRLLHQPSRAFFWWGHGRALESYFKRHDITKASSGRGKLEFLFTKIGLGWELIWPRDRIDTSKERVLHPLPPLKRLIQSIMTPPPHWIEINWKRIDLGGGAPPLELIGEDILGVVLGCHEGMIGYGRLFLKDRCFVWCTVSNFLETGSNHEPKCNKHFRKLLARLHDTLSQHSLLTPFDDTLARHFDTTYFKELCNYDTLDQYLRLLTHFCILLL